MEDDMSKERKPDFYSNLGPVFIEPGYLVFTRDEEDGVYWVIDWCDDEEEEETFGPYANHEEADAAGERYELLHRAEHLAKLKAKIGDH
jgi:hypothetical protein